MTLTAKLNLNDNVNYCSSNQSTTRSTTQPFRDETRISSNRHQPNQLHSSRENVSKKEQPGRRRVAVACSRCRKRKIKCSGDLGNGQGCQSCKNAGSDPISCQFLRIASQKFEFVSDAAEWPYLPHYVSSAAERPSRYHHMSSAPIPGHVLHSMYYQNGNRSMRSLGSSSYQDVHKSGSEYDISQHNHPFSDGPKYNNSYDNINSTERTLEHYNSTGHHDNYLPSQDSRPPSTLYDANYVHRTCGSTWIIRSGPSNYISELPSTQTAHSVSYAIPLPPAAALASHNSSTCPSLGTPGGALSASLTSERVLLTPKSGMVPPSTGNIVSTNQTYCPESPSSASYTHPCSPKLRGTLWGLNGSAAEESKASLERILNSGGILCSKPSPHMNFPPNSSASDSFATPSSISAMETISSSANGFNALVSNTLSSQPFIPTLPTESTDSLRRYAPGSFDSHCQSFKRSTGSLTLNGILINGQP